MHLFKVSHNRPKGNCLIISFGSYLCKSMGKVWRLGRDLLFLQVILLSLMLILSLNLAVNYNNNDIYESKHKSGRNHLEILFRFHGIKE